ncbi:GNAT family N-acetyltransferase [Brumimicrobium aurantiacum]|uniref:GNAT family N-acetyltransferase n=1 Tax=Brumimicrobium aurantiacum TaxID=1737063 RepID=A0A3E1EXA6_9FLAO|nr:GNAT family N-acetyltransferase [Brumimicrobium aurantiacum]RFC54179.1 GNAT family N-acetyltransferase [Brumimicrobium aurantiacum]
MKNNIHIRKIQPKDNPKIAKIIRQSLEEYDLAKPGTVYTDPTTDALFESFENIDKSVYFIATLNGEIIGGSGIFPTNNLPDGYAELVKIYLKNEYRGKGIGKQLMNKCIAYAKEQGYTHLYLESFPSLKEAIVLYEKIGFERVEKPLGDSGHFACDVWMVMGI